MNTRRSSVHADERMLRYILFSPYRCRDCDRRFWVISRDAYFATGIIGVALVAGAVAWGLPALWERSGTDKDDAAVLAGSRFADLVKRAEGGDRNAEYDVAVSYLHGYGVAKSEVDAQKWLERAAVHGNLAAKYEFGVALRDGRGAVQDYVGAAKWIRRAAEDGHVQAQLALGNMYRVGTGVPLDNVKAYTWLNIAAARGVKDAAVIRDTVLTRLSPTEVAEAQAEARRLSETLPAAAPDAR